MHALLVSLGLICCASTLEDCAFVMEFTTPRKSCLFVLISQRRLYNDSRGCLHVRLRIRFLHRMPLEDVTAQIPTC